MKREELKALYGELYAKVEEILFRLDPVEINFATNIDEYEPEVDTILPRLQEAKTEADVHDIVCEEFVRWFEGSAGYRNDHRYQEAAKEIWSAWVKFSEQK